MPAPAPINTTTTTTTTKSEQLPVLPETKAFETTPHTAEPFTPGAASDDPSGLLEDVGDIPTIFIISDDPSLAPLGQSYRFNGLDSFRFGERKSVRTKMDIGDEASGDGIFFIRPHADFSAEQLVDAKEHTAFLVSHLRSLQTENGGPIAAGSEGLAGNPLSSSSASPGAPDSAGHISLRPSASPHDSANKSDQMTLRPSVSPDKAMRGLPTPTLPLPPTPESAPLGVPPMSSDQRPTHGEGFAEMHEPFRR